MPTGATGLQDERLELHEVAESVGAPEAHGAFYVPAVFSTGYSDLEGAQGRSGAAMGLRLN
jgi:hypothetical protein